MVLFGSAAKRSFDQHVSDVDLIRMVLTLYSLDRGLLRDRCCSSDEYLYRYQEAPIIVQSTSGSRGGYKDT